LAAIELPIVDEPDRNGKSCQTAAEWNADDHRLFPPKRVGIGWTINLREVLRRLRVIRRTVIATDEGAFTRP
jgi:hypothetical protein